MAEQTEEFNVVQDRMTFLMNLQKQVDAAYAKRLEETPAEGTDTTVEQLEAAEKFHRILEGKPDDEIINFGQYGSFPYEVVVDNPHDYKDLVEMAVRMFWQDDEYVAFEVKERLRHELIHGIPLLGYEGCGQVYGVHFYREKGTNKSNFTPFVEITGKAPVGLIRESIEIVPNLSFGDKVILGRSG